MGSWVVLPEPVSPATTITWLAISAARISSTWALMGSASSKVSTGGSAVIAGPHYPSQEPWLSFGRITPIGHRPWLSSPRIVPPTE